MYRLLHINPDRYQLGDSDPEGVRLSNRSHHRIYDRILGLGVDVSAFLRSHSFVFLILAYQTSRNNWDA